MRSTSNILDELFVEFNSNGLNKELSEFDVETNAAGSRGRCFTSLRRMGSATGSASDRRGRLALAPAEAWKYPAPRNFAASAVKQVEACLLLRQVIATPHLSGAAFVLQGDWR